GPDADEAQRLPERALLIVPRRDGEPDRERPEEHRRRLVADDAPVRDEVRQERRGDAGEEAGAPAEKPAPDGEDEHPGARRAADEEEARRGEAVLAERADAGDVLRHRRVLLVPHPGLVGEIGLEEVGDVVPPRRPVLVLVPGLASAAERPESREA